MDILSVPLDFLGTDVLRLPEFGQTNHMHLFEIYMLEERLGAYSQRINAFVIATSVIGIIVFYRAIHIEQRNTPKETITIAHCERAFNRKLCSCLDP